METPDVAMVTPDVAMVRLDEVVAGILAEDVTEVVTAVVLLSVVRRSEDFSENMEEYMYNVYILKKSKICRINNQQKYIYTGLDKQTFWSPDGQQTHALQHYATDLPGLTRGIAMIPREIIHCMISSMPSIVYASMLMGQGPNADPLCT